MGFFCVLVGGGRGGVCFLFVFVRGNSVGLAEKELCFLVGSLGPSQAGA